MTKILTISYPHDIHALAVRWGLSVIGFENDLWYPRDFPSLQKATIRLTESQPAEVDLKYDGISITGKYDVIWQRRSHPPLIHPQTHPLDQAFADRQNRDFTKLAQGLLAENAIVVNPFDAHWLVEQKVKQMEVAQRSGFRIPDTIVSNDPDEIRIFARHHREEIVYKALQHGEWQSANGESGYAIFTKSIALSDLQNDVALTITPGIFQKKVTKEYELRVTVMGSSAIAVKIDTQHADCDKEDWRIGQLKGKSPPMERYDLPHRLAQKCIETVRGLGLLFGCIDLIVTPEHEVFFLENNSMGQFLWCEACPGTFLLDPFCRFLLEPTHDFSYSKPADPLLFRDYLASSVHHESMAGIAKNPHAPLPKHWIEESGA